MIHDRHRHYLGVTRDPHAAALLVVAEQLQALVRLLTAPGENAVAETPVVEHHEIVAPLAPMTINLDPGVEFIKKNYVG